MRAAFGAGSESKADEAAALKSGKKGGGNRTV
jgi:hypothetical protein